jgi:flagellar hook-length control protein FliK
MSMELLEVLPQTQIQDNAIQPAAAPQTGFKDVLARGLKNGSAAGMGADKTADKAPDNVRDQDPVAGTEGLEKDDSAAEDQAEETADSVELTDVMSLWQAFLDMQAKAAGTEKASGGAASADGAPEDAAAISECKDIMARVASGDKVSAEALNTVRAFLAAKLGLQQVDPAAQGARFSVTEPIRAVLSEASDSKTIETAPAGPRGAAPGTGTGNDTSARPASAFTAQASARDTVKSAASEQETKAQAAPASAGRESAPQNKPGQENTFGFNLASSHTPATLQAQGTGTPDTGKTAAPQLSAQLQERILDIKQLAQDISLNIEKGGSEMNIHLKPESLGDVSIRAVMDADGMRVSFKTDNLQARQLMESSFTQLKEVLEMRGIKVADFTVGSEAPWNEQSDGSGEGAEPGAARRDRTFADESDGGGRSEKKSRGMGRYTVDYLA